jgi:hypothetical protein
MGIFIRTASASQELKESSISTAITRIAMSVAKLTPSVQPPVAPALELSFLLPGKHEKPDFQGMQMGGFSHENGTLFFECAVPESMLDSHQAVPYVLAVLDDVISNAVDYFQDEGVAFDHPSWLSYLKLIKQDIA